MPWDLPEDRLHFRRYTTGRWLLLGRTTFEEMTGWFRDDHTPLVMSRNRDFRPLRGRRVASVEEAAGLAEEAGQKELVVCGGGQIYAAAMPLATRLVITRVASRLESGVPFPTFSPTEWKLVKSEAHAGSPSFCIDQFERGVPSG